jgi:[protein-PII] uridylyltransferase
MSRTTVKNPRAIIDRKALTKQLDDLVGWSGYTPNTQGEVLSIFKDAHGAGWEEIKQRFEAGKLTGPEATRAHALLMDQLIRTVHDFADKWVYPSANPTTGEALTIIATGGYGRGELAPFSDIDLMFLLPYKMTPRTEQIVEFMLYMLWDLGLKVGHATRSVEEAVRLAKEDLTIRTSLLEARWLWGDQALFDRFRKAFWDDVAEGSGMAYVEQKLAERDNRHDKMGDTRYVLEPNIKEGKGGLRDLQTLIWIAKYLYRVNDMNELVGEGVFTKDDMKLFEKAENFLWTVRCHLHYLVGRPEERLNFSVQKDIAKRLGYRDHAGTAGVERFMKHYFLIAKDVGDITRILCAVLEHQHKKPAMRFRLPFFRFAEPDVPGFKIDGGRLTVENKKAFANDPVKLVGLFHAAQKHDLDIHPEALRLVTQNLKLVDAKLRRNKEANRLFLEMLTGKDPVATLMRFNEAGVFGRFVPDFGRVVAQMQYDMYHVYTVDEHTIRAIGLLNGIETGRLIEDHPVACEVISEVQSREALYVSVLLHDIAKGRGGDHSELGAEVALKLCPRFGLNEWETDTVSWLVRHHLLMSATAFKRDLDDPKTIQDFCDVVQSPERLRLLLCLTVVDIRAVGPNVWNNWKAGLLRELYWQAKAVLLGGGADDRRKNRVERAKRDLEEALAKWPKKDLEDHLARGTDPYWLSADTATQVRHAELVRKAEKDKADLTIDMSVDKGRAANEITVYTADHPGLFANIAGALSLAGVEVLDAKIATLTNGMALDTFWVHDAKGKAIEEKGQISRMTQRIEDALRGKRDPARELKREPDAVFTDKSRAFAVSPRVIIDNQASNTYTVIEINGHDRPGFLYDVTSVLTREGLQIASAQITTYGERVVDVFYVKDIFGLKVRHPDKLKTIEARLLDGIGGAKKPARGDKTEKAGKTEKQPAAAKAAKKAPAKSSAKPAAKFSAKASKPAAKAATKPAAKSGAKAPGKAAEKAKPKPAAKKPSGKPVEAAE